MDIRRIDNVVTLRQLWPEIVGQLQSLKSRCREAWMVEDVWAALIAQRAQMHVGYVGGKRVGFIISEQQWDAFAVKPVLNIWIAVGQELFAEHGAVVMTFMRGLAREQGATKVRMSSPRKGWERVGLDKLMAPVCTVWECEVAE